MMRVLRRALTALAAILFVALLIAPGNPQATARSPGRQVQPDPGAGASAPDSTSTVISYQGMLTDDNGSAIDRLVEMEFALYDAESGGNLLWGPESHSVEVTEGSFHVLLGSSQPINPTSHWAASLWLDITVDDEVMTPRERLGSSPFALGASADLNLCTNSIHEIDDIYSGDKGDGGWATENFVVENPYGSIRLRAASNVYVMLDKDNTSTDAVFRLQADSENPAIFQIAEDGTIGASGTLDMNGENVIDAGKVSIGTASPRSETAMQINTNAVPVTLKETDQSGAGSLWRIPLDGTNLRFDASQNGTDFASYKTPLTMYANGTVGCGAITENNLQTPDERAAGGSDRFEEGDVLCWSAKAQRLEKCSTPDDPLVQAVADKGGRPIVIGAEVINVIGPVRAGDYLVASSVPGYAMASRNPTFGVVIAQALEDLAGERGLIKAMIRKM